MPGIKEIPVEAWPSFELVLQTKTKLVVASQVITSISMEHLLLPSVV